MSNFVNHTCLQPSTTHSIYIPRKQIKTVKQDTNDISFFFKHTLGSIANEFMLIGRKIKMHTHTKVATNETV